MTGVSPKYAAQAPVKSMFARLNPPASCSMAKLRVFFTARAEGVRGTLASALAEEDVELAREAVGALMAAAEPANASTPTAAAARNQTLLCIAFPPLGVRQEPSTAAQARSNTPKSIRHCAKTTAEPLR